MKDITNVTIHKAKLSELADEAAIGILAKRRSGKTYFGRYLVEFLDQKISRFVTISGNKDNMAEWKKSLGNNFVVGKDLVYLKKLRDWQDSKVHSYTEQELQIPKKYKICIVFDDVGSDRKFMYSDIMKDILSNGRHYGMTIIILLQYLNQMPPENRDNLDYIAVLRTSNNRTVKKLHEEYVNVVPQRTFKCVLSNLTLDRGVCWIDNVVTPTDISDCVYYSGVPKNHVHATVGDERVRQYGDEHYSSNVEIDVKHDESDDSDSDNVIPESNQTTYVDDRGYSVIVKKSYV